MKAVEENPTTSETLTIEWFYSIPYIIKIWRIN